MQHSNGGKGSFIVPPYLLNDIGSRFLLDAPDSELSDPIALCFLTELAYWFYLDECLEEDDNLNTLKFDPFALQLFKHMDMKPKKGTVENMLVDFREFKLRVPTYGAIFLNENFSHVLLVQGFWRRASWGFPKGKINVDEEPHECAIREVVEETGHDIALKINKVDYLETTIGEQKVRLYVIPGVSMDTEFVPQTKGEIKEFKWYPLHQLPTHKNDRNFPHNMSTNMFYNVMPFVKLLRSWIANRNRNVSVSANDCNSKESRRRHKSLTIEVNQHKKSVRQASPAADFSKTMTTAIYYNNVGFLGTENFANSEKFRNGPEASPKKKDTKQQKKKKNKSETVHEEHQKFSFKVRNKHKGNHKNAKNNSSSLPKNSKQFQSYTWQTFKINKKSINEALDKVWGDVSL